MQALPGCADEGEEMISSETPLPAQRSSRVWSRTVVTVAAIAGLITLAWRDPTLAPEVVTGLLGVVGFHHLSSGA